METSGHNGFYLSAAHKSSGKTIVTIGICAVLRARQVSIQPFKKGPDYIDPLWLTQASGRDCINLDFHTQSHEQLISTFTDRCAENDFGIVEGNKGLHDGVAIDGSDSNAELAALLGLPVVLVLDTQGTTRGIAPLLLGYQHFDSRINLAGVILNRVAGPRHEQKLRDNIESHTDVSVIGVIPRDDQLRIDERHLGLTPNTEMCGGEKKIEAIKNIIESSVDLEFLTGLSSSRLIDASKSTTFSSPIKQSKTDPKTDFKTKFKTDSKADIKIGIPRDAAFGFYYVDDFNAFRQQGAELVFYDSLEDPELPDDIDGLFIGGGFPEVQMTELERNQSMRKSIFDYISNGGPTYAECGGLMYLGQSIAWHGGEAEMVGALPLRVTMEDKPVGRGYVRLKETCRSPWGELSESSQLIHAHEFHYSRVEVLDNNIEFAYEVERGWGFDGQHDGLIYKNVLASFCHLRSVGPVNWVEKFTRFIRNTRVQRIASADLNAKVRTAV